MSPDRNLCIVYIYLRNVWFPYNKIEMIISMTCRETLYIKTYNVLESLPIGVGSYLYVNSTISQTEYISLLKKLGKYHG